MLFKAGPTGFNLKYHHYTLYTGWFYYLGRGAYRLLHPIKYELRGIYRPLGETNSDQLLIIGLGHDGIGRYMSGIGRLREFIGHCSRFIGRCTRCLYIRLFLARSVPD